GLAYGDLDGDGKLDLLTTATAGPARLFRNTAPTTGHWLMVRTRLPSPLEPADRRRDRDALGAEVTVEAGTRRRVRLIHAANSYLCSSEPCAHVGLGPLTHVDRITVRWPDGSVEQFAGTAANRRIEVRKGEGQAVPRGGP